MELKQIKELIAAMERNGLKKIQLRQKDFELVLEREEQTNRIVEKNVEFSDDYTKQFLSSNRADQALARAADKQIGNLSHSIPDAPKENVNQLYVTSPMVGTFYSSSSPDDANFIKVGDRVDKNTIVCIIEAMKVMNEVKANGIGTVAEILVETGQPVEFGTKLFRIVE